MKQKIYSDRTELEGVDLPSAGQTRFLVVDENKKIKSEVNNRHNEIHYSLVSLYEAELLNLHNTPINIPLSLQPNEYAFIAGGLSYIEFSGIESGSGEIEMLRIQIINEDDEVLTGHTVSNLTLDQKRCNVLNVDPPSIIEFFNPPATKMSITTPAEAIITQPEGMVVKVKVAYMIGEF